ncbi:MAG: ABC transporter ATP-binding protein [Thermoleophilia bacterium]
MTDDARRPAQEACAGHRVVLSTHQLTKDFKGLRAVDHLDLSVCEGDVFGFLGPNGAGKTTTIRMILGLIYPTEGYVQILDHRVPDQRLDALRHVGGFVDVPAFYKNMSARRNLRLLGRMSGEVSEARIDEVLDMVGLSERGGSKVGSYSHGMGQRLGIAQALIHRPALVILDEPTSGLDPQGMKDVRELVRELGRQGTTVFLSSHLLHEVEQVCNRAVIMDKGRIIVQGPVSELRPARMSVKVVTGDQPRAEGILRSLLGSDAVDGGAGEYIVVSCGDDLIPEIVRQLVSEGIDVRAVVPAVEQGLEDFFLQLTGDASKVESGDSDSAGDSDSGRALTEVGR